MQRVDERAHFLRALARRKRGEQNVLAAMFDEGRDAGRLEIVLVDETLKHAAGDDRRHALGHGDRQGAALGNRVGDVGILGEAAALDALTTALARARVTAEPIGLLSHHLAMDGRAWDFLRSVLEATKTTQGLCVRAARELFAS